MAAYVLLGYSKKDNEGTKKDKENIRKKKEDDNANKEDGKTTVIRQAHKGW